MKKIKILIADDEPLALELLASMLGSIADVEIVGRCRNGREVLRWLADGSADLLFLDIQMPGRDGISVVKEIQADVMPLVIFATAYDEFALQAFDIHAVDYVLKPFSLGRLETALDRARDRLSLQEYVAEKGHLISAFRDIDLARKQSISAQDARHDSSISAVNSGRLPIKDGQQTHLVNFADIAWIDAAGDYMCVHAAGQTYILRSTMKELAQRLPSVFARVHRSTIVNLSKIQSVNALPKGEWLLHLEHDVSLKVSRNYRSSLKAWI